MAFGQTYVANHHFRFPIINYTTRNMTEAEDYVFLWKLWLPQATNTSIASRQLVIYIGVLGAMNADISQCITVTAISLMTVQFVWIHSSGTSAKLDHHSCNMCNQANIISAAVLVYAGIAKRIFLTSPSLKHV